MAKKSPRLKLPGYTIYILDTLIFLAVAVALVFVFIPEHNRNSCPQLGGQVKVVLNDSDPIPNRVTLSRCDQLVLENKGSDAVFMNFGNHDDLQKYTGFKPQTLQPGKTQTIVMTEPGPYVIHDHLTGRKGIQLSIKDD